MSRLSVLGVVSLFLSAHVQSAYSGGFHGGGCYGQGYCHAPCITYQEVQRTVMVPVWEYETRTVPVTQYVQEQRQRTVVVNRVVPETRQVTQEYTVLVPQTRTRTVQYNVCRTVWREEERPYTVQVPYRETVQAERTECQWIPSTQTVTVMVPETRYRTEQYTVCRPVVREVQQEYTVNIPYRETREATRTVCRTVPVTETRTVTHDRGHWAQVVQQAPACGHAGCGHCCNRSWVSCQWVPNLVQEQVEVTCYRPETVQVPYRYEVTVCRPETRTRTVHVTETVQEQRSREVAYTECVPQQREVTVNRPQMVKVPYSYTVLRCRPETRTQVVRVPETVTETQSREVPYTVCVPETRTRTYNVTTHRCVPEERVETYTVCVPRTVERQIQVRVCRMVPQTVTCQVPVCHGCGY